MKSETGEENRGTLQAIRDSSVKLIGADQAVTNIDHLIDLSDPYSGYIQEEPSSPFLPAVFAAAGYPYVHTGWNKSHPNTT